MTRLLETRLRQLEARFGHLPCDEPGHDDLFVFLMQSGEEEPDADTLAKIKSIRACERCKDRVIVVTNFGTQRKQPEEAKHETLETDFVVGEGDVVFSFGNGRPEQKPAVPVSADGLKLESKAFTMVFGRADEKPGAKIV